MRKLLISTAIAVLPSIFAPAYAQTSVQSCETADSYIPVGVEYAVRAEPGYVGADDVNVRRGPSTQFIASGSAIAGAYVEIFGQAFDADCNTWLHVRFPVDDSIGWIRADLIELAFARGWWD